MTDHKTQVTQVLSRLRAGSSRASEELLPLVYAELRSLAASQMSREAPGHTLQATALVHEAYLRLVGGGPVNWSGRGHFFAAAAEAMRRILVERARHYGREKHGASYRRVPLALEDLEQPLDDREGLLALDQALQKFEAEDPERAQVVKLRYFAGLTIEQTADVLDCSPATVKRRWTFARVWLYEAMCKENRGS